MKYAIVLPDGAADEPVPQLAGRTPLDAANKPNIDWIAEHGEQGLVTTVPPGFSPGSDVATLSLFGYDPTADYTGRAPLEAAAQGISAGPDALIFRCNFVTILDGKMHDFTAGHIPQAQAIRLIATLNDRLGGRQLRFHGGVSYRNLMVASDAGDAAPQCTPPHDIPDQPVARHLPQGPGAEHVQSIMTAAHAILASHEVNAERAAAGQKPVTDVWLWGQGRLKPLAPFATRFGLRGAVIAAVDLIRGIARVAGMDVLEVKGATGYLDTDYAAKGRAAVDALGRYDVVIVHVEAPDEAGHQGDAGAKVKAIEEIDRHVVGPLLIQLRSFREWRVLVVPDHPTPVTKRVHTGEPPPFCMAGTGISRQADAGNRFTELAAKGAGLHVEPGRRLLSRFFAR